MRHISLAPIGLLLFFTFASSARAQSTAPAVFVGVNGGYQSTTDSFQDHVTFQENAEQGRFDTDYAIEAGSTFNVSGGVRIWRALAAGVSVTRFTKNVPTELSALVPHPFFFSRNRTVEGTFDSGKREETAIHIQVAAAIPIGERWQVTALGGPSIFQVKQSLVDDFSYSEAYPYDSAEFVSRTLSANESTVLGVNAGVDLAFYRVTSR